MSILFIVLLAATAAPPVHEPILGFTNCNPALLWPLPANEWTVSVSEISYDSFGRTGAFVEEFRSGDGDAAARAKVTVSQDPGGNCPKTKYTVELGGKTRASGAESDFKTAGRDGSFGFTVSGVGGITVVGKLQGSLETAFSYDGFGRRQLARQAFTYSGRRYEVTYSNVKFDGFGRLSGYQASLKPAPPK